MYLFIDTISTPAVYILFGAWKEVVDRESFELKGRESEYFLDSVLSFLTKNNLVFKDIEGVIAVNGPGSFTAMRIITLTLNTLSFVHHIPLYAIDYFTLGKLSGWQHPVLLRANRGEYLIQKYKDGPIEITALRDIQKGQYFWMGDENDFTFGTISIQSYIEYEVFYQNFTTDNPASKIEPIYIKKPNIT